VLLIAASNKSNLQCGLNSICVKNGDEPMFPRLSCWLQILLMVAIPTNYPISNLHEPIYIILQLHSFVSFGHPFVSGRMLIIVAGFRVIGRYFSNIGR
jgi:hypothetical protein